MPHHNTKETNFCRVFYRWRVWRNRGLWNSLENGKDLERYEIVCEKSMKVEKYVNDEIKCFGLRICFINKRESRKICK